MKNSRRLALPALWVLAAASMSNPALAQTPAEGEGLSPSEQNAQLQDAPEAEPAVSEAGLGEIVVTATRRATNRQDTPVAVSAIDQGLIEQASPRDIGDLAAFVTRSDKHTSELQSLLST